MAAAASCRSGRAFTKQIAPWSDLFSSITSLTWRLTEQRGSKKPVRTLGLFRASGKGQDHLRAALVRRRNKLMSISEATGVGIQALDSYSCGEVRLAPAVLKALTRELFGASANHDPGADAIMLVSAPPSA